MINNVPNVLIQRRGLVAGVLVYQFIVFALGLHRLPSSFCMV